MATISVRSVSSGCLSKAPPLSLKKDTFGVYGNDNPQTRPLRDQLNLVLNKPFVRVVVVTITDVEGAMGTVIQGQNPSLQRDLDSANAIYQNECDAWIYCVGSVTVDSPNLLVLAQNDCSGSGHSVSIEEDDLFDLGRSMGADIVGYYISQDIAGFAGCAAHPPGRRGFWVGSSKSQWTFTHELTHVVGDNPHERDTDNLMSTPTKSITNPPPDLTDSQRGRVVEDEDIERCKPLTT